MALSNTINYDTAGNFTFNSDLIEFSGSVARLKVLGVQGDEVAVAKYDSDVNLLRGNGTLTGTATNASIVNGELDLSNEAQDQNVEYNTDNLPSGDFSQGCIRLKYKPDYTGSPAADQRIVDFFASGNANRLRVLHTSSGNLELLLFNNGGGQVLGLSKAYSMTSGTEIEIEVNWNLTGGVNEFYVDGSKVGTTDSSTGTYSADATTVFRVGGQDSDFFISDLQVFDAVQHTSDFSEEIPRVVNIYSTTNPTTTVNSGTDIDGLVSFSENVTIENSDEVKYALVIDGQDKYFNGTSWLDSDGTYSQANTDSEINANAAALDVSSGVTLKLKAFLHAGGGITTPTLTSATLSYNFFSSQTTVDTAVIYGYLIDNDTVVSGGRIRFYSASPFFTNGNYINVDKTVTSRSTGYFEASLPVTGENRLNVEISYKNSENSIVIKNLEITVPDVDAQSLETSVV